jgi:hypothetical protein
MQIARSRLAALALGAALWMAAAPAALAGPDCPPGWARPVTRTDAQGTAYTWRAGAT